jgi:molybdate transport system substrate-binding protein
MKKALNIISILFVLLAVSCSAAPKQVTTLTVLAAASLTEPFQEIGARFEDENPGVTVVFNFAGSQQLAQQLAEGAPADVFASANRKYMNETVANGRVAEGDTQIFATNQLVVITSLENTAEIQSLADLARANVKLVLAAEAVPVGKYSLEFLEKATQDAGFPDTFKQDVLANVVSYEDNVKSVLTKVLLGEADAGIVYTSDISGDASGKVLQIPIPSQLNILAEYPIAVVSDSSNISTAQAFVNFVASQFGRDILATYGFQVSEK